VDPRLGVNADEFESSTLEYSLSQFLCGTQRCNKHGAIVPISERFGALSDAAYDVVAWGFDFYRYPLAFRRQCNTVDRCIADACGLHGDLVA
jgi:hypothetical protein